MPIQDLPCYVTPEEWERFAALTGSSERHIAWLREQLEAQIANCDLDFFPDDEHRAAWRRGYVDAVLNFGCPAPRCCQNNSSGALTEARRAS